MCLQKLFLNGSEFRELNQRTFHSIGIPQCDKDLSWLVWRKLRQAKAGWSSSPGEMFIQSRIEINAPYLAPSPYFSSFFLFIYFFNVCLFVWLIKSFGHLAFRMPEVVMVWWMTKVVTRTAGDPWEASSVSPSLSALLRVKAKAESYDVRVTQILSWVLICWKGQTAHSYDLQSRMEKSSVKLRFILLCIFILFFLSTFPV